MWRIAIALEFALLLLLIGRRAHHRWPGLVAFLTTMCARDAVGIWADWTGRQTVYCLNYYIGTAIVDAAQVWLILDICLHLVGPLKNLRAILIRNVPAMTSVFIFGAILASIPHHPQGAISHIGMVAYYCRRADAGASLGASAALILVLGIALNLKIQFSHGVRPVAVGLLIETGFSYVSALEHANGWVAQPIFSVVRCLAYVTTLVCFSAPALVSGRDRRLPRAASKSSPNTPRSTGLCCN